MSKILELVENHLYDYYGRYAQPELIFHSMTHVHNVVKTATEIAENSDINEEDLKVLKIACWFHDVGHMKTWEGHEEIGANIAEEFLKKNGLPQEKIEQVRGCILATKMPHDPKNILQEIICDADIAHIGKEEYFDRVELLKMEIEKRTDKKISNFDWLEKNKEFLTSNRFFTKYARLKFDETKSENLIKVQKKYDKAREKKRDQKAKKEKLEIEKEKITKKKLDSRKSDRGIETMFRNVIRTHVNFSAMADNKANIMISVNTLLLGAVFALLAGKLDSNPHLIIPTIVLTFVSLVTLIISIRVTRPSISSGIFTKDDIEKKKVNLLFFGNFYKMNLNDFSMGMNAMMDDKEFLYGSMIKDFYYLGQVLGAKYKLLRLAYTVFMYGITASAIIFILFIWLYPNMPNVDNFIE